MLNMSTIKCCTVPLFPGSVTLLKLICGCLLFASPALASDGVASELSHATGGALIAGAVTGTVANKYWPEHRAMVGFTVSTATILIGEGVQVRNGARFSSSLLDVASHTIGAAIGAIITDRYFLMPVLERDGSGSAKIGIVMQRSF